MIIGYARVSTRDQNLDSQLEVLEKAGCERIYSDKISSRKTRRPQFEAAIALLQEGDILVVWRLNRMARSLRELIDIIEDLRKRNIELRVVCENIDTTSSGGRLIFHLFGAVAEFDRDMISENTHIGLESARTHGRIGGRPRAMSEEQIGIAQLLLKQNIPREQIAEMFRVSRATLYRCVSSSLLFMVMCENSLFDCAMGVF